MNSMPDLTKRYIPSIDDICVNACNAPLDYAVEQDNHLRPEGDEALIDDKTVFIIKRS